MKISVITINYNNIEGLKTTIQSVSGQKDVHLEYIIVDGNSTDGAQDYLKTVYDQGVISKLVSEPDKGLYDAMNKGLELATGDYILFMNSGDCFFDDYVLSNIEFSLEDKYDVIYGKALYGYNDGYVLRSPQPLSTISKELPFCHQASLVRTSLAKCLKFDLNLRFIADYNMFYSIWRQGGSFKEINDIIAIYDATGMSANKKNARTIYEEGCYVHNTRPTHICFLLRQTTAILKSFTRLAIPTCLRNLILNRPSDSLRKHNLNYYYEHRIH